MAELDSIAAMGKLAADAGVFGEGTASRFDREAGLLYVSADFYGKERGPRVYRSREEIGDPLSRLQWDLYDAYPAVNAIALLRSRYVLLWASAGRAIPPLNAFHAEHFYGEIPCTERDPLPFDDFEERQLALLRRAIGHRDLRQVPAVLLRSFGAFVFAEDPQRLMETARALETAAQLAWELTLKEPRSPYLDYSLLNEYHYLYNGGERWMQECGKEEST